MTARKYIYIEKTKIVFRFAQTPKRLLFIDTKSYRKVLEDITPRYKNHFKRGLLSKL